MGGTREWGGTHICPAPRAAYRTGVTPVQELGYRRLRGDVRDNTARRLHKLVSGSVLGQAMMHEGERTCRGRPGRTLSGNRLLMMMKGAPSVQCHDAGLGNSFEKPPPEKSCVTGRGGHISNSICGKAPRNGSKRNNHKRSAQFMECAQFTGCAIHGVRNPWVEEGTDCSQAQTVLRHRQFSDSTVFPKKSILDAGGGSLSRWLCYAVLFDFSFPNKLHVTDAVDCDDDGFCNKGRPGSRVDVS